MMRPLPWQQSLWAELQARLTSGNLPHALLFTGAEGIGKAQLAEALIHRLLCNAPQADGAACGQCQGCGLLMAGSHPDIMRVEPAEAGKAIPVDVIREVGNFLALKGQYSGRQIVLVNPAEAMNRFAANSLLKTLEEPSEDALLILISSKPSLLLPTIRSRCQQLAFPRPDAAQAGEWLAAQGVSASDADTLLALTDGAPLLSLTLHAEGGLALRRDLAQQWAGVAEGREDPLSCAAQWAELGLPKAVHWLASWLTDLIRLKSGAPAVAITNRDLLSQLQTLAERIDLKRLFSHLEQISEYNRWAAGQLNTQLALEDLMISWSRLGR
jgi:DNA polymerase-3 subunit delta'